MGYRMLLFIYTFVFYPRVAFCRMYNKLHPHRVMGMTLNCIHIFINGSFLYRCVIRPATGPVSVSSYTVAFFYEY